MKLYPLPFPFLYIKGWVCLVFFPPWLILRSFLYKANKRRPPLPTPPPPTTQLAPKITFQIFMFEMTDKVEISVEILGPLEFLWTMRKHDMYSQRPFFGQGVRVENTPVRPSPFHKILSIYHLCLCSPKCSLHRQWNHWVLFYSREYNFQELHYNFRWFAVYFPTTWKLAKWIYNFSNARDILLLDIHYCHLIDAAISSCL